VPPRWVEELGDGQPATGLGAARLDRDQIPEKPEGVALVGVAENARRTRQAVVRAAADLFVANGYTPTSLAVVAAEAGVARPTVFAAFGSKAALLRQVLDEALAGDDEPVPVAQRPWFQPVWDATTPSEVVDAYAEGFTLIGARAARIFEVVRRAADESPELAEIWETLLRNRPGCVRSRCHRIDRRSSLGRRRASRTALAFSAIGKTPSRRMVCSTVST
jgi:AcrR family transcriptional regulator